MNNPGVLSLCLCLMLAACSNPKSDRQQVMVFAAASLTDVLPKIIATLHDSLPATEVIFNFASSSMLAQQIAAGSPAEVFFSADQAWMAELVRKNLVDSTDVVDPGLFGIGNRLVVVVPASADTLHQLEDLAQPRYRFVALGDLEHVPAGRYARLALQKAGLWEAVAPKVVSAHDVRGALSFVEIGEADAGIVYATDARVSRRVRVALTIPPALQPKIRYALAPLHTANAEARRVVRLLQSQPAGRIFTEYGFTFLPSAPDSSE